MTKPAKQYKMISGENIVTPLRGLNEGGNDGKSRTTKQEKYIKVGLYYE